MSNTRPSYSQQNDYRLLRLEIVSNNGGGSIDLMPQFIELDIFESIYETKMVGELLLVDALNYSETIPIVGNETIFISFVTPNMGKPINIVGKVFAVLGKARTVNEKSETYKLQFVSEVQFENSKLKISGAKAGTIGSIADQIYDENFGVRAGSEKRYLPLTIDPINNKIFKFVFPYWSPLYAINWLSKRSFSPGPLTKSKPSCFMFYEDVDGFHIADLIYRMETAPISMTYRYEPMNQQNFSNVNKHFEKVQDYQVDSYFDRLGEYRTGMYSGYLMTHDITRKKMHYHEFDYHDAFRKTEHLNYNKLISSNDKSFTDAKMGFMNCLPVQTNRFDSIKDIDVPENFFMERASILRQFNTLKMTLLVNGNSSLRLLDVIDFDIPKAGYLGDFETNWKDSYLSGRYMIVSLKHMINREVGYNTTIGIAKDSITGGIPDRYGF